MSQKDNKNKNELKMNFQVIADFGEVFGTLTKVEVIPEIQEEGHELKGEESADAGSKCLVR